MSEKILKQVKIRNFIVSLAEYRTSNNPFWRVDVKSLNSVTSAPYDDYKIALLAWKDRVNDISIFG